VAGPHQSLRRRFLRRNGKCGRCTSCGASVGTLGGSGRLAVWLSVGLRLLAWTLSPDRLVSAAWAVAQPIRQPGGVRRGRASPRRWHLLPRVARRTAGLAGRSVPLAHSHHGVHLDRGCGVLGRAARPCRRCVVRADGHVRRRCLRDGDSDDSVWSSTASRGRGWRDSRRGVSYGHRLGNAAPFGDLLRPCVIRDSFHPCTDAGCGSRIRNGRLPGHLVDPLDRLGPIDPRTNRYCRLVLHRMDSGGTDSPPDLSADRFPSRVRVHGIARFAHARPIPWHPCIFAIAFSCL